MALAIEKEFSIKFPISMENATIILKSMPWKRFTKYLYSGNKRRLLSNDAIICDIKTETLKRTIVTFTNDLILNIVYKESKEELVDDVSWFNDSNYVSVVHKNVSWNGRHRWSINNVNQVWFLECELEMIESDEYKNALDYFTKGLFSSPTYSRFLYMCFDTHPMPLEKIITMNVNTNRPFSYNPPPTEKILYYAPKLDGCKYKAVIYKNKMIVPELNRTFAYDVTLLSTQMIIAQVEFIGGDTFFLIDVCSVASSTGEYCSIDHLQAIDIMDILRERGIMTNSFYRLIDDLKYPIDVECDGYLAFSATKIYKFKERNSVDLIYKRPKNKNLKSAQSCLFFSGDESFQESFPNVEIIGLDDHPDVEFLVLEFNVFTNRIVFYKMRQDKIVSNSIKVYLEMCK